MKIEFNNNDKSKRNHKGRSFKGGFEDMMAERKKQLPEFQAHIQEHLADYNGEMVAVIKVSEDENGDPTGTSVFVGGVCTFESSMKMLRALDEAKDAITTQMAEGAAENPEIIGDIFGNMLSDLIKKHGK